MIKNINFLFVTFFGLGTVRYAPGTITSLITATLLFSLFYIFNLPNNIIFILLFLIFLYSFYAVSNYIKDEANKDPKEVVIDEVIGQSIPICMYEIAHGTDRISQETILYYFCIFTLFRFFDIKKPFPVSYFDKNFKNSFGVIIDDVVAGLYVVLTLILFMIFKSKLF
jgi:phosphatidylglycerophosphatase A